MEYHRFKHLSLAILGCILAMGLATGAQAAGDDTSGSYTGGLWGPLAGPRECDATNEDGYCIAWHSTLKGISPARIAQCNAFHCDLRPDTRPHRPTSQDNTLQLQLAVVPHVITPLVLDGQAKPHKGKPTVRVEGPSGDREYGPIQPLVIDIGAK